LLFADDKSEEQQEINGGLVSLAPGKGKIDHLVLKGGSGKVIKGISLAPILLGKGSKLRYQCSLCKCTFKWRQSAVDHIDSHFGNFVCPICNKSLKTNAGLKQHLRIVHSKYTKKRYA
jgi:Zinc finger, C2H2 type